MNIFYKRNFILVLAFCILVFVSFLAYKARNNFNFQKAINQNQVEYVVNDQNSEVTVIEEELKDTDTENLDLELEDIEKEFNTSANL